MRKIFIGTFIAVFSLVLMLNFAELLAKDVFSNSDVSAENQKKGNVPFINIENPWIDSVMNSLTWEEKIGQLLMIAAYSNKDENHYKEIETYVKQYGIGGLIFMQGGPVRQAHLTNRYQNAAKVPLLIAMDAEWGLAMRLDSTISYPKQMALGAVQNTQLIYNMGADIAKQCQRLGVHVNFAPVVDVNVNPNNPVINYRAFGENKDEVALRGIAYSKGMQDNRVLAVAKHFPGHGDTDSDSHKTLPIISHSKKRIFETELVPFKKLYESGTGGAMVAHLYIPSLDNTSNLPSTLSKKIVKELLVDSMRFEGLIFTDALNMQGVAKYYQPGEIEILAFAAGNEVLLFPQDVPKAISALKMALSKGEIDSMAVVRACKKILQTKYWTGAFEKKPIETKKLVSDLNASRYVLTNRRLVESSITLLKNRNNLLPIKNVADKKIAVVSVGESTKNSFSNFCNKYAKTSNFSISKNPSQAEIKTLFDALAPFDLIVIGLMNTSRFPGKRYGITPFMEEFVNSIGLMLNTVIAYMGNPYGFHYLKGIENSNALLLGYEDNAINREMLAQAIFGGVGISGKLPVTSNYMFTSGFGLETSDIGRFKYSLPEELNIDEADLFEIDKIVINGINESAFPGCQVLVAKEGKVIYNKTFGHHTYEKNRPVLDDDLYDIASITKIAASTLGLMKLQEKGLISLDHALCDYIPEIVEGTNVSELVLRDILAHQSGLQAGIITYQKTLVSGYPKFQYYSMAASEMYPHKVAKGLYMRHDYPDSLIQIIANTPLRKEKSYHYSDLGYYFIKAIIEKLSGKSLDNFLYDEFYHPMGLATTVFKPLEHFSLERIPPTEYELTFRKQQIHGTVHDPGAAMLGGVAGHAGIFSSANDLAKIFQMLTNGGEYGGRRYLDENIIREYTKCQFCNDSKNRRGAGFDKPVRDGEGGPTCPCISLDSFGHSGFTGTLAWSDPDKQVTYVFLSNRIYPSANNKKLITMNIRSDIMQVIYDAIEKAEALADSGEVNSQF